MEVNSHLHTSHLIVFRVRTRVAVSIKERVRVSVRIILESRTRSELANVPRVDQKQTRKSLSCTRTVT